MQGWIQSTPRSIARFAVLFFLLAGAVSGQSWRYYPMNTESAGALRSGLQIQVHDVTIQRIDVKVEVTYEGKAITLSASAEVDRNGWAFAKLPPRIASALLGLSKAKAHIARITITCAEATLGQQDPEPGEWYCMST